MPRAPRIVYGGAIYHILARGDRREPIVFDDEDRELVVATLSQVCAKSGWEVFAWVLMDNHYHLALRTPEPNLVEGMKWFQNAFTRRINTKHRLWGHLFGGRYKAIVVEDSREEGGRYRNDYLTTLIDYIHLNPTRAGLVDGVERSSLDYRWSSLPQGYALAPSKRPDWLAVQEGMDLFGEKDTLAARKRLVARLDEWSREEERERTGLPEIEGQSLQSTRRRGWYWGAQEFRERLVERFGSEPRQSSDRNKTNSELVRDHQLRGAKKILDAADRFFNGDGDEWRIARRGDLRRVAVAWALARKTTMKQSWIAEQTNLRTAANVSQRVRRFDAVTEQKLTRQIRKWKREMSKFVK